MNSEEHSSADAAPAPGVSGPGATLRAAREAKRLDLGHIAAETRIPLRHLEAIEADNFESLPSRTYAIGFARTYAKVLELDDVAIVDAVRAELADGSMRRTVPSPGMEPGDPARVPSSGLAWAMAAAALVLAVGAFAFYNSYFRAGTGPGSLIEPQASASAPAKPRPARDAATASSGPVVFTALADGIWVRLYEEGGERLTERTLKLGETIEVPVAARDPRINTGRPDALSITIGGQPVAKLSEQPETISGVAVSAAALAARVAAPAPGAAATPPAAGIVPAVVPRRAARPATGRASAPRAAASPAPGDTVPPAPAGDAVSGAEVPSAPGR